MELFSNLLPETTRKRMQSSSPQLKASPPPKRWRSTTPVEKRRKHESLAQRSPQSSLRHDFGEPFIYKPNERASEIDAHLKTLESSNDGEAAHAPCTDPAEDPDFQKAFLNVSCIAGQICEVLGRCETAQQPGTKLFDLHHTAKNLNENQLTTSYRIGLVGDAGQGKSSTLNSLLETEDLATVGDSGVSVTSFVTEYSQKLSQQNVPYVVVVKTMSWKDIETLLREFIDKALRGLPGHPDREGAGDFLSQEELDSIDSESESAFATLRKIFPKETIDNIERCSFGQTGYVTRILKKLLPALQALEWPGDMHNLSWHGSAASIGECQGLVRKFTQHKLSAFIEIMRVYLDSKILSSGVVLADIPGFHDTNGLRVKVAEKYSARCDGIFVVANIGRIASNATVLDTIKSFRRLRRRGDIKGYLPTITVIATSASHFSNYTKVSDEYRGKVDMGAFQTALLHCTESRKRSRKDESWAKYTLEYLQVPARNSFIAEVLGSHDPATSTDVPLAFFGIDNADYFNDEDSDMQFALKKRSGIPDLRQYCIGLPAQQRFKEMDNIIKSRLPAHVNDLKFWLDQGVRGDMVHHEPLDVTDMGAKLLQELTACIQKSFEECKSGLDIGKRQKDELRKEVSHTVVKMVQDLTYHTIKAFCRRRGDFKPKNKHGANWNEDIVLPFAEIVEDVWPDVEKKSLGHLVGLEEAAQGIVDKFVKQAKEGGYPNVFLDTVTMRRSELKMNVANSVPSLKKILDILRANLIEHGAESYVSEYMEAHYVMCDTASGKGARAQMVLTLFDACSGKSNKTLIFSKIIRRFESDTESALHEIEKTLRSAIDKFTSDIELQIESVGQSNESIEVLHKYPEMKDDLTGAIEMATEQMEKNEQLAQRARQTAKQCGYLD